MGSQDFIWRTSNPDHGEALARAHGERMRALSAMLKAPFGATARLAGAGWARLRRFAIRRACRRALGELSDAQLKDIGIGRSEISYAAWALEFERDRAALRARHRAEPGTARRGRVARLVFLRPRRPAPAEREMSQTTVNTGKAIHREAS